MDGRENIMKKRELTKSSVEFEYLGEYYRCTTSFLFENTGLICIEVLTGKRKPKWVMVYSGHTEPLRKCLRYFDKSLAVPEKPIK